MKRHKAILLALALSCHGFAAEVQVQTNDAQKRALEVLRQFESMEPKPAPATKRPPHQPTDLTFEQAQQQYLDGKMTAKEFQRYLETHKVDPASVSEGDAQKQVLGVASKPSRESADGQPKSGAANAPPGPPPAPAPGPTVKPAQAATDAAPQPGAASLTEVENKMDELLRLKEARDAAAATNASPPAATNSAAAAPKTKRERLNDLLRQVVDGKITDAEYKEKRSKIVSEPD
jgi:hypothetical protein